MNSRRYVVDRIEGTLAVLEADGGGTVDVPVADLPGDVAEGAVFSVPVSQAGVAEWGSATRDRDEERRRLDEAKRILEDLKKRDRGGNIVL